MPAELRKIPGVDVKRRHHWPARHRNVRSPAPAVRVRRFAPLPHRRRVLTRTRHVPWSGVLTCAGCTAVGLYLGHLVWSATRVQVTSRGVTSGAVLTSKAMDGHVVRLTIHPTDVVDRATLRLDGAPVPEAAMQLDGPTLVWRPKDLPEGRHELKLSVPRPALSPSVFRWRFRIDDTPPRLDVPALLPRADLCEPVSFRGAVEPGAKLTVGGRPVKHKGTFSLRYDRPPSEPVVIEATDRAGNVSRAEVVAPVRYPGGQGVHVSAAAWGYEPLRRSILGLIDARLISVVELDLKDEDGFVGYDSRLSLPLTIGAVQPEYRLAETVADLKGRGVRVVGRIVAFRDPLLAEWAWGNGKRDWVIQAPGGGMFGTGFTNHVNPEVHQYNVDVAVEAAGAGVDDILWDYVRRPEGDPSTMVVPGLHGTSADGVIRFLTTSGALLRERCVFQGASVFGIAADRPDVIGQDVPRIARHVDYIAPMVYPSHWVQGEYGVRNPNAQPYDIVKASLADFQDKVAGTGVYLVPWLQDFSLGYPYGPAEVRAQIDAAAQLGIPDWLLWNAGGRYTAGALNPALVALRS